MAGRRRPPTRERVFRWLAHTTAPWPWVPLWVWGWLATEAAKSAHEA